MYKYNLSNIMKDAWKMVKKLNITLSTALKIAWKNAKLVAKTLLEKATEEVHTWYGWTLLGKEVIHDSKCLFQIVIEDLTTKKGTRTLSYFGASQVCELGSQD